MNNFDLLIEKYRNELIQAKKRSIVDGIADSEKDDIILTEESTEGDNISTEKSECEIEEQIVDLDNKSNFADDNDSFGTLKIQIFAADRVYPVQSAMVTVKDSATDELVFEGYSDASGIVDEIVLKAPSAQISQSPSNSKAYSEVDILIKHPRFITTKYLNVPIFSGVESIQTVQLIPTNIDDRSEIIIEQSEPESLERAGE